MNPQIIPRFRVTERAKGDNLESSVGIIFQSFGTRDVAYEILGYPVGGTKYVAEFIFP